MQSAKLKSSPFNAFAETWAVESERVPTILSDKGSKSTGPSTKGTDGRLVAGAKMVWDCDVAGGE